MSMTLTANNPARALAIAIVLTCWAAISAGCAGTESRQSTGEFVDDAAITTKVKTALVRDDRVDAIDVQIKTFKGVVQLSGFADSEQEKQRAGRLASRVAGVERVQNDIRIKRQ